MFRLTAAPPLLVKQQDIFLYRLLFFPLLTFIKKAILNMGVGQFLIHGPYVRHPCFITSRGMGASI